MNQRQGKSGGNPGSADIETGKPQDTRENRHPGESNLSQNPQQAQQNPNTQGSNTQGQRGQHDEKQFGNQKGSSQQQGNNKGGQQNQEHQGRQGHEQGRNPSQTNVQGGQSGNQGKGSGQQSQQGDSTGEKQYGEGNYKASKDYNERTKQFVDSGRVEQAAKDAAPRNEQESREMKDAEREGRRPMREEDPEINPDKSKKPGHGPDTRQ